MGPKVPKSSSPKQVVESGTIFSIPGQYIDGIDRIPPRLSLGEANISPERAFMIFFVFDFVAHFISLVVVAIESEAKKRMVVILNKLMWLACVLISMAFLALSFIVVGEKERWLVITHQSNYHRNYNYDYSFGYNVLLDIM
ncbi:hypothetical protein Ancab_010888 [Ancistrocladus abbreviatus]